MRVGGLMDRVRKGACAVLAACAAALLAGCAASTTYAGIPLAAGAADPELQSLARRAQAGDKHAQLELGIRYEEGRGLTTDLTRARKLYRRAAGSSGGTVHAYSPPASSGGAGRVIALNLGPRQGGLAEAKARLEKLK